MEKEKKLPLPVKLMVGAAAGVIGTSCIFPIDIVKTRLQATDGQYKNPLDCFLKIIRNEGGLVALYRGLLPNLIGVTPEKAIKLAVNELLREKMEDPNGNLTIFQEILAGAGAGSCQVIATNPMEMVKIRLQVQALQPAAERLTAVEVVRNLGLKGMYQGSLATFARDVPFSIIFFPAYANLKESFKDENGKNSMVSLIFAGTLAGAIGSGTVTPADVIKTRLQVKGGIQKYKNLLTAPQIIIKEEGVRALFKGVLPRMAVVGPLFGIALLSFEIMKDYMVKTGRL